MPNAASNCWKMLAAYLRYFAKKKTTFEGQIDWPCYFLTLTLNDCQMKPTDATKYPITTNQYINGSLINGQ